MNGRVSKAKIETQGRTESGVIGEQKQLVERSESQTCTEAYQAILARELFIQDFQEDHCKSF